MYELNVFGRFRCEFGGVEVEFPAKGAELLAYLVVQPHGRSPRRRLGSVLWPDVFDERALGNLSTTIWRVRRAMAARLGPEILRASRNEVMLNPQQLKVDHWNLRDSMEVAEEHAFSASSVERAIAISRKEFLEGVEDIDWVYQERERLRRVQLDWLRGCARRFESDAQSLRALEIYRHIFEMDRLNEEVCRDVIRLNGTLGRKSDALRTFAELSSHLRTELSIAPDPETVRLLESVRRGATFNERHMAPARRMPRNHLPLEGRHSQMDFLNSVFRALKERGSAIVGIQGEAGVGKTRLVAEFAEEVRRRGHSVSYSKCEEVPKALPYEALLRLLRERVSCSNGVSILDEHRLGESRPNPRLDSDERAKFYESIANLLVGRPSSEPDLAILEDLQFSDSASLEVLTYIAEQRLPGSTLLIVTWRSEDGNRKPLRNLRSCIKLHDLVVLERLEKGHIQNFCRNFFAGMVIPDVLVDCIHAESEGNPLFAIELLRSIESNGDRFGDLRAGFREGGQQWSDVMRNPRFVPQSIRENVARRLGKLPRAFRSVARFAATCGRSVDIDLLSKAMEMSWQDVVSALDALVDSGLLIHGGDAGYEFAHDKIRALCYDDCRPALRTVCHRRVLAVLERSHSGRLRDLAFHSERAGERVKAGGYWASLGDEATAVWAHMDGVYAYTRALANWEKGGAEAVATSDNYTLFRKRAASWGYLGQLEKAEADIQEMSRIAQEAGDKSKLCESLVLEAQLWLRRDRPRRALDRTEGALRLALEVVNPALEADARECLGLVLYRAGQYERALGEFQRLEAVVVRNPDQDRLERVWNNIGRVEYVQGKYEQALQSFARAEENWTSNLNERGLRNFIRGSIFSSMCRAEEAVASLVAARSDFRRAGNSSGEALASNLLSFVEAAKGNLASALMEARRGLPFKCGRVDVRWHVVSLTYLVEGLCLGMGSYDRAEALIRKALRLAPHSEVEGNVLSVAAAVALEKGDPLAAEKLARDSLTKLKAARPSPYLGSSLLTMGKVLLCLGDFGRAYYRLRRASAIFEASMETMLLIQTFSYLGLALRGLGSLQDATAYSGKAVEMLGAARDFGHQAQTVYWNHFRLLLGSDDREAVKALHAARRLVLGGAASISGRAKSRYLAKSVNTQIIEEWDKRFGQGQSLAVGPQNGNSERKISPSGTVRVALPFADVPRGRQLRAEDFQEILWTVEAGAADERVKHAKGEVGLRRARILRLCAEAVIQGCLPREGDLARVLRVSTRTIRSDLRFLKQQGCHVRTRGHQRRK